MRAVVLTTSYPHEGHETAGTFVQDAVAHLRSAGVEVVVVSPASFRHYGIAYGDGIVNNLRARKWRLLLLPLFFLSFARAARRASRHTEVVHAHWLPSAVAGLATGKPLVVQLWGSDVELAKRLPWLFGPLLRRAQVVICPSRSLADEAQQFGARDVRLIPGGVDLPESVGAPEEPPHVLYVGRLSEEKGVRELAAVAAGLPLVVVGDGPLRHLLPQTVGFVPHAEVGAYYERASIVVVPSRREGYGFVAHEAMAYGRAVVATNVGGLRDAIEDGLTGTLVPPHDPTALRTALDQLLADPELRGRLGATGRRVAVERFGWDASTAATAAIYRQVSRLPA